MEFVLIKPYFSKGQIVEVSHLEVHFMDGSSQRYFSPEPVKPPVPPVKQPRKNVGINLAAVRYWSSERVFNNLARASSGLVSCLANEVNGWGKGPPIDANNRNEYGFPIRCPSDVYYASVLDLKKGHPTVRYALSAKPAEWASRLSVNVPGQKIGNKVNHEQRFLFRIIGEVNSIHFEEEDSFSMDAFYEPFVSDCSKFECLRFMNWNQTNDLVDPSWGKRVTPEYFFQAEREVALEYQIQLCNKTGKPFWYNVHHAANDVTVREVALKIQAILNPGIPVIVEYTNEAWNGNFESSRYAKARSPIGNPMEWHFKRTVEVGRIFRSVIGSRVKVNLGSFTFGCETLEWVIGKAGLAGLVPLVDQVSIAPYFGHGVSAASKQSLLVGDILDDCREDMAHVMDNVEKWVAFSKKMGWELNAYEGGAHLAVSPAEHANTPLVDAYVAANRDGDMEGLYDDFLRDWNDVTGGALICLFESCSKFDKFGCWGLREYYGQPLSETPKMRAVLNYMAGN